MTRVVSEILPCQLGLYWSVCKFVSQEVHKIVLSGVMDEVDTPLDSDARHAMVEEIES